MPLDKYFKGAGRKVMRSMKHRYGAEKGKRVFYATANKLKSHRRLGTRRFGGSRRRR